MLRDIVTSRIQCESHNKLFLSLKDFMLHEILLAEDRRAEEERFRAL
jgi:hypothetical protein